MKKNKLYFLTAIIFITAMVLPKVSLADAQGSSAGVKEVKIGVAVPITGRFSFFGKQLMNGLFLSLQTKGSAAALSGEAGSLAAPYGDEHFNIKYMVVDLSPGAGPKTIESVFRSFAMNKVSAVIGPMFGPQVKYFESESLKYKIPAITPAPASLGRDNPSFLFSYGMTLKHEIATEIKYAANSGIKSISVIYPNNVYGLKLLKYIEFFSSKYGLKISGASGYTDNATDFFGNFSSIVKFSNLGGGKVTKQEKEQLGVTSYNLMNGITKAKPIIPFNGLFIIGSPSKMELILTQLAYYNISGFPIFGLSSLDSASFMKKYAFYMKDAVFPDGFFLSDTNKAVQDFKAHYKAVYGKVPNILSAEGYDIGGIIKKTVSAAGFSGSLGSLSGEGFYRALIKIKQYKGVCGISRISGNRFKKQLYLFEFKNNTLYLLQSPFGN